MDGDVAALGDLSGWRRCSCCWRTWLRPLPLPALEMAELGTTRILSLPRGDVPGLSMALCLAWRLLRKPPITPNKIEQKLITACFTMKLQHNAQDTAISTRQSQRVRFAKLLSFSFIHSYFLQFGKCHKIQIANEKCMYMQINEALRVVQLPPPPP